MVAAWWPPPFGTRDDCADSAQIASHPTTAILSNHPTISLIQTKEELFFSLSQLSFPTRFRIFPSFVFFPKKMKIVEEDAEDVLGSSVSVQFLIFGADRRFVTSPTDSALSNKCNQGSSEIAEARKRIYELLYFF